MKLELERNEATLAAKTSRPIGRREQSKIEKLRRIKEAARYEFLRRGFDNATARDIAKRADVALGTIFIYAVNKRDLLFLVANDEFASIVEGASRAVCPNASLLKNLMSIFRVHYELLGRQPKLSRMWLRELLFYDSGTQADRNFAIKVSVIRLIEEVFSNAIAKKEIAPPDEAALAAWLAFGIYQVEVRAWLLKDKQNLGKGLKDLKRSMTLFLKGMNPQPAGLRP